MSDATVDNLNALLEIVRDERDRFKEEARVAGNERDNLRYQLEQDRLGWSIPREWKEDGLPVPRLELHWRRLDDSFTTEAVYMLVRRHFLAAIGGRPSIVANVLGVTTCRGGNRARSFWHVDELDLPFRESAHMSHDAKHLELPLFGTTEDGDQVEINRETRAQRVIRRHAAGIGLDTAGADPRRLP
jgi:hypothetical protein